MGIVIAVLCWGCRATPEGDTVEVIGDTIFVASRQAGVWGETRALREDLRIGSVDGPIEFSFGEILELALTLDGGVALYDGFVGRVSIFSSHGEFLGYIGRRGQGPGEFSGVRGVAVLWGGEILICTTNDKVLVFSPAREYLREWSVPHRIAAGESLVALQDGRAAVTTLLRLATPVNEAVLGFQFASSDGAMLDSLGPLDTPWDSEVEGRNPNLFATKYVQWSPLDFGVAAVSSRLAFQVFERNGGVVRVQRRSERPMFVSGERREHQALQEFLRKRSGQPQRFPDVPERKPAFGQVILSRTGEIYFQMRSEAIGPNPWRVPQIAGLPTTPDWLEALVMEAFDRAGRYLGRVEGPPGVVPMAVSGDTLWGLNKGALGETYVVRFLF